MYLTKRMLIVVIALLLLTPADLRLNAQGGAASRASSGSRHSRMRWGLLRDALARFGERTRPTRRFSSEPDFRGPRHNRSDHCRIAAALNWSKTYPVKGKVTYKGTGDVARLAGGQVHFESVGQPRVTGSGEIEKDGRSRPGATWRARTGKGCRPASTGSASGRRRTTGAVDAASSTPGSRPSTSRD